MLLIVMPVAVDSVSENDQVGSSCLYFAEFKGTS